MVCQSAAIETKRCRSIPLVALEIRCEAAKTAEKDSAGQTARTKLYREASSIPPFGIEPPPVNLVGTGN